MNIKKNRWQIYFKLDFSSSSSQDILACHRPMSWERRREKFVNFLKSFQTESNVSVSNQTRSGYLMQCRQPVYIGVIDISSLSQELRHLVPVSGGASGHEHGALGEAHSGPPVSGSRGLALRLHPGPVRLRALPPLQLILPPLLRRFGPGTVSGRHLPPSVSPGEFQFIRQVMSDSRTIRSFEPIPFNDSFEPIRLWINREDFDFFFITTQLQAYKKLLLFCFRFVFFFFSSVERLTSFDRTLKVVQ